MVMEALGVFSKAKELGFIGGVEVRHNGIPITHLQLADDTIMFSSAHWEDIATLKRILRCF